MFNGIYKFVKNIFIENQFLRNPIFLKYSNIRWFYIEFFIELKNIFLYIFSFQYVDSLSRINAQTYELVVN
jgi:hypothetical protein